MDVGIEVLFDGEPGSTLADCAQVAAGLEAAGFASMWVPDHVVLFERYAPNYPYSPDGQPFFKPRQGLYDPLFTLAAAAAATSTIRLGTGILILPERNPVVLAQEVVALDHLSGGRLNLGVGLGWSPEEYDACGVPWSRRGTRADEYLEAMTRLWTEDLATYQGEFVSFQDVVALPKPVQQPRPPVLVGGHRPGALRRAARLADGWFGWALPTEEVRPTLRGLDAACEAAGREPATLSRTLGLLHTGDTAALGAYLDLTREAGAAEVVVAPWVPDRDPQDVLADIAKVAAS